jgi:dephospho-CoA kinase
MKTRTASKINTLHIFIAGGPGTGKTTLARFFKEHGKNAYDGDLCNGMWLDQTGKVVKPNYKKLGKEINVWAEKRGLDWVCDKKKFNKMLRMNKEMYLFGGPTPRDPRLIFDKVYWLNANRELIIKRLKKRVRDKNSYHKQGSTKSQRDAILKKLELNNAKSKKEGYDIIDASLAPKQIFDIICMMRR